MFQNSALLFDKTWSICVDSKMLVSVFCCWCLSISTKNISFRYFSSMFYEGRKSLCSEQQNARLFSFQRMWGRKVLKWSFPSLREFYFVEEEIGFYVGLDLKRVCNLGNFRKIVKNLQRCKNSKLFAKGVLKFLNNQIDGKIDKSTDR